MTGSDLGLALAPEAPERLTLPHFLEDVAARFGARTATRFEGVDVRFDELAQEARRMAAALFEAGVGRGDRVAVLIANRPEWVAAAFGAARLGAVVVPVNTFATPDERDYILGHCDARLLLMQRSVAGRDYVEELLGTHPELAHQAAGMLALEGLPDLRRIVCLDADADPMGIEPWDEFRSRGVSIPDEELQLIADSVSPDDSGLMIYTSGTTDHPKGVLHYQRAAVIQSWRFAEYLGLTSQDVVFTAQPFFWTAGIAESLGATLAAGATLLLQETFDPESALDCIERERATTVLVWPHQEKAMAEHPSAAGRDLTSLHRVEFDLPLAGLIGLEEDVWGVYAAYGMTETFTLITALPSSATAEERADNSGRILPGMEIRIVDPESGEARAVEEEGEIIVRGVTLMERYWKVPLENAIDADGFFHTGDGGFFDARGRLHWKGRLSGMIKTGGANVSPIEVEKAAIGLPGVRAAVAIGVPHPTLGEALVLCLVPTAGSRLDADEIRARLRTQLAAYKRPRHLLEVGEDQAPTTGNQKLQAEAFRSLALERMMAARTEIAGHVYEARGAT